MTLPVVRLAVGVLTLALTAAVQAATPVSLPDEVGDAGRGTVDLPLPPAPPVERADVTRMRLVIRQQPRDCRGIEISRKRAAVPATPPATVPTAWMDLATRLASIPPE